MSSFLSKLCGHAGTTTESVNARQHGLRGAVSRTRDFERIEALPRRQWDAEPGLSQATEILTEELARPCGGMRLWKLQAAALRDIVLCYGGFFPIPVGGGKALISLLAPVALRAQRPVLFVPAQVRKQTKAHVLPDMRQHWKLHPGLRIFGYSELSLAKNAELLERLSPDLIILDEAHRAKNLQSGRTKRLVRYFRSHPETMCIALSGTIAKRSIKDFAHIIRWCLKERSPLPTSWHELCDWADCLDADVPERNRMAPGALARFCREDENPRQGFRRRLMETPGVVSSSKERLGVSLRIRARPLRIPPSAAKIMDEVRASWETPNGDYLTEAIEVWRQMRQLALGFWYRWDPPAPDAWMEARKAWKSYVRETLRTNRRRLDTELQVWNDCKKRGSGKGVDEWRAWNTIRDTFKPNTVAEWISDFAIEDCCRWADARRRDKEPGIIWTEHGAFAARLSEKSGAIYHGAGDDRILDSRESVIIASIAAHGEGKNLQHFRRGLITAPPSAGKTWEQLLGRSHRPGQLADEVDNEVYLYAPELLASFQKAIDDARFLEDTGERQKLNYADFSVPESIQRRAS